MPNHNAKYNLDVNKYGDYQCRERLDNIYIYIYIYIKVKPEEGLDGAESNDAEHKNRSILL
jgi:hypothetical protein